MITKNNLRRWTLCSIGTLFFMILIFLPTNVSVKAAKEPGDFKITNIKNNKKYKTKTNITVKYSKAKNLNHYRYSLLDITSKNKYTTIYKTTNNKKKTYFTIEKNKLKYGHKYKICLCAYSKEKESKENRKVAKSVIFSIAKKIVKPSTFKISSPSNNKKYSAPTNIKVTYTKANNVNHYKYSLSDTTNKTGKYTTVYKSTKNGVKTYFTIAKSKLKYGHKYRIYVNAYGDSSESKAYKRAANCVNFSISGQTKTKVNKVSVAKTTRTVKIGGAHNWPDDVSGDKTGTETSVIPYENKWVYVIRPKSKNVANRLAYVCEFLCNNKNVNVGYTQYMSSKYGYRDSLFKAMVNAKGNLSKLKGKTYDADCSSFVTTCLYYALIGTGYEKYITYAYDTNMLEKVLVTGNSELKKQFSVVQNLVTDKTKSNIDSNSLQKGDILLRPKSKQAIVGCTWGHTEIVVYVG